MTPVEAPDPPYLFVDLYPLDFDNPRTEHEIEDPPWEELLGDDRVRGIILKATDGERWGFGEWLRRNYIRLEQLLAETRGVTRLLGGYAFLQLTRPGATQADYYVREMTAAGWRSDDILAVADVELGNDGAKNPRFRHPNQDATNQQIIDCTGAFAQRVMHLTGRPTILYGRGALRDRGIVGKLGCDRAWDPSYTRTMVTHGLEAFTLDEIVLWQNVGDGAGDNSVTHLPLSIAGHGVDISVAIDGDRKPTWERTRARLVDSMLP